TTRSLIRIASGWKNVRGICACGPADWDSRALDGDPVMVPVRACVSGVEFTGLPPRKHLACFINAYTNTGPAHWNERPDVCDGFMGLIFALLETNHVDYAPLSVCPRRCPVRVSRAGRSGTGVYVHRGVRRFVERYRQRCGCEPCNEHSECAGAGTGEQLYAGPLYGWHRHRSRRA